MKLIDRYVEKTYKQIESLYNNGKLGEESIKKILCHNFWEVYSATWGIAYNVWKKRDGK